MSSFSPILIVLPLICAFERPLRCTLCVTISGDFFCVKSTHNALSLFESSTNPLIGPLHAGLHPAQLSHWLENEAGLILIHVCLIPFRMAWGIEVRAAGGRRTAWAGPRAGALSAPDVIYGAVRFIVLVLDL